MPMMNIVSRPEYDKSVRQHAHSTNTIETIHRSVMEYFDIKGVYFASSEYIQHGIKDSGARVYRVRKDYLVSKVD